MNLKSLNICLNLNANILPKHSDIHNYPTRNKNKFIAPKCNMRKSEMSIKFKSIEVWNKLPADIRTSDSLNVFMDNLGNYFLSRYWVHHWCIFYFLRYAVSLCNVLPTIGQYFIDISIVAYATPIHANINHWHYRCSVVDWAHWGSGQSATILIIFFVYDKLL